MLLTVFWRRWLSILPTLLIVSLIAFALIRLAPGDPIVTLLGERGASPEVVAELRNRLGLDQPLIIQYLRFIKGAAVGDFGDSIVSQRPVWLEFKDRFPATIELALSSLLMAILVGVPLGIVAAVRRNSWLDRLAMGASLVGYSMPIFWWGLLLILIFSVDLGWTPVAGRIGLNFDIPQVTGFMLIDSLLSDQSWPAFRSTLKHLILPTLALGTVPLAAIARMSRSAILEVMNEDYIRTARAKGLSFRGVVLKHALKNALIPIVTVIGLMGSTLLTGAILTENIFAWPGIGKWLAHSVQARDYPVIQGGLVLICFVVVVVNVIVDMIYFLLNPMMREQK